LHCTKGDWIRQRNFFFLWTQALLPLFPQVVGELGVLPMMLLCTVLLLVSLLIPAMWHQWVVTASANSNYLYSMTTLWGVWQVRLLQ
jgi:hypothetical protein